MKSFHDGMDIYTEDVSKIWFSNSYGEEKPNGDCDCDCDSACPNPIQSLDLVGSLNANRSLLSDCLVSEAAELHYQNLDNGYQLVSNPTGSGNIAVFNRPVASLFACFRSPTTLGQVKQALSYSQSGIAYQTILQLLNFGFLKDLQKPMAPTQWMQPQTLTAWLHITNECNLRCPYCYLHKSPDEMSTETVRQAIDAVFRSAALHNFQSVKLKYAGGEASLNMRHVLAAHDYASSIAEKCGITLEAVILSNGVALSAQMINELADRQIRVMISLDGVGEYHDAQRPFVNGKGSFQHVNSAISRLLDHHLVPHISITVSDRNLAGLSDLIKYVLDRELPFSMNYYRENNCSVVTQDLQYGEASMIDAMRAVFAIIEENLPRRSLLGCLVDRADLSAPHQRTCGVGQNYLVIDQNGGVAKCQMDIQNTITTIREEDVLRVIQNDQKGIQNLAVEAKEGCKTCEWRYWCTGGCPMLTHRATGRYDVKSPNCHIYKALYPDVLRLEALRLLKYQQPWMPIEAL